MADHFCSSVLRLVASDFFLTSAREIQANEVHAGGTWSRHFLYVVLIAGGCNR